MLLALIVTSSAADLQVLPQRKLADLESWYAVEPGALPLPWVGSEPEPEVEADAPPVDVPLDVDFRAVWRGEEIAPVEFAGRVGDRATVRSIRGQRAATIAAGTGLMLGGAASFFVASQVHRNIAMVPATIGWVAVIGGTATFTFGTRKFSEMGHWYTPEEAIALTGRLDPE